MFTHKVDHLAPLEVEFSSKSGVGQTVAGTLENEYTLVVPAPGKYLQSNLVTSFFFCF